ncbi:MAG: c-type cytochrome [Chrysiogenetes bacterium]|nr:c-type cytochrome [Chrysiogenetes bacterium]
MSDEKYKDRLLGHEYDGIQEYDNPLPGWWTWMSIGTVIFAIFYVMWMYMGLGGMTQEAELEAETALAQEMHPELFAAPDGGGSGPDMPPVDRAAYVGNDEAVAAGKEVFTINCVACHGVDATGGIGPNLTDNEWIHGGKYDNIRHTITVGVPEKGMVTWGPILGPEKIAQVAAFVYSLGGGEPEE